MRQDRRSLIIGSATGAGLLTLGMAGLGANISSKRDLEPMVRGSAFPKLPIGMNLAGISDWEPGFPFRNLFWGARPWLTRNLSGSGPQDTKAQGAFQFDENGYPLQVPVAAPGQTEPQTVFTYVPNCRKPGIYILLYDGEGEIDGLASTKVVARKPGRVKLRMSHVQDRYEAIVIKRSTLGNHVRNIRLVAEADENVDLVAEPFLPEFLDFCQPFHCLRFMDWAQINNSTDENWAGRKSPTFYTMVGVPGDPEATYGPAPTPFQLKFAGGVAIEIMIQLCNMLKIDAWLCVPHRATDDYIAQFAKLVREKLDPGLNVYLEYSNEVWNWMFTQAGWMIRSPLAGALVEAKGGTAWKDSSQNEGTNHPERIGALFRRMFAIWEREWTGDDRKRLIRVGPVQAAWYDASMRTIKWCIDNGGVDAISPTAYIGPNEEIYAKWSKLGTSLSPEVVIDDLADRLNALRENGSYAQIVEYGKRQGLKYVAYEGGQHIQPEKQAELPYNAALAAAQTHPRMYDLYVELLRLNRDAECTLFMHFSSVGRQGTRWGSWGAKATYDSPNAESPKMRALIDCNIPRA
jgi:hypothetical protein